MTGQVEPPAGGDRGGGGGGGGNLAANWVGEETGWVVEEWIRGHS